MFDMNHVARMLKDARIRKNLTQSALADRIGVTYQAVSNWERGSSLPDLANLSSLCENLNLDLYELVGASQDRALVDGLLSDTPDLSGAPMDSIASLAPLLPPEQLMEALRARKDEVRTLSALVQLAPFIDGDLVEELGADLTPAHIGEVVSLSPFVSTRLCASWIDKLENFADFDLDVGLLSALGPYLPQEKLDRLSERVVPDTLIELDAVAPFLSRDALERLAGRLERIEPHDYLMGVECLSPFLGLEALERLHKKVVSD